MTRVFSYIFSFCTALAASQLVVPSAALGQEQKPAIATPETIVVVPHHRAEGVRDLRSEETEHEDARVGLERAEFTTIVRVQESEGERRTVAEVLARGVGVNIHSLGGLGSFSSMSVRGADPGQTTVLVDGLELSRIASVAADLGQLEIESFERIELYRGGVPTGLGGAGVGGAVNLQTALGVPLGAKPLLVSLGFGYFGAKHLRARFLGGKRDTAHAYQVSLGYSGARGDFSFFDDGRTPLTQSDDSTQTRLNNGYERFDLVARLRHGPWTLGSRTSLQVQGLPGDSHLQALQASLSTLHQLADAKFEDSDLFSGKGRFKAQGFASVERQHFSDPSSEIGLLSQDAVYRTTSTGLRSSLGTAWSESHDTRVDILTRLDWFRDTPVGTSILPPSGGNRQSGSIAFSEGFRGWMDRFALTIALRADLLRTRPSRDILSDSVQRSEDSRVDRYFSPRASARLRLTPEMSAKASVGKYLRTPTLIESFGDRGFLLGNAELRAEEGITGDVGLLWAPPDSMGPLDRIYLEAAAFASRATRPIVFVNRNGLVAQAINLEGAQILGAEFILSLRLLRRYTLSTNYGLLNTSNRDPGSARDKQLPGRPTSRFYARIDAAFEPKGRVLVLWSDLLRQSGNYVDQLNLYQLPPRSLVGVGVKLEVSDNLLLGLEVKNATDIRKQQIELDPPPSEALRWVPRSLSDVHGFPLPGRSLYFNLQWTH